MNRKTYTGFINNLSSNQIFVFGSNPEGRHGKGVAKIALDKYNATYGQGHGLQGQSYGLITKNLTKGYHDPIINVTYNKSGFRSLSEEQITNNIKELYELANEMKDNEFFIAYTIGGKNLNGYTDTEMAKMFHDAKPIPENIIFEDKFLQYVMEN